MAGNFIKHISCPHCGSSDAGALYSDGGTYCYACHKDNWLKDPREEALEELIRESQRLGLYDMNEDQMDDMAAFAQTYTGPSILKERKINSDTARFYGVTEASGSVSFPYGPKAKVRTHDKKFAVKGGTLQGLFGQDKFPKGGKVVAVVEGEMDALSAYQMLSGTVPVVSVPNGAAAALKDCQKEFEYLDSFDTVVVCFDNDEPGKKAAQEVAELFGAKAKLTRFENSYKDANDYLTGGSQAKFVKAFWAAEQYRPEGVVSFDDIIDRVKNKPEKECGVPWCFETLTNLTHGRRKGEVYTIGAGVGVGKTDFMTQQMAFDIDVLNMPVGVIYLEQDVEESIKRIAGKRVGKMLHIPGTVSNEELTEHLESCRGKGMFFEHFGAKDWNTIEAKIRYMNKAHGIESFYFDHLTALIADVQDPRRELDRILARIASMGQNLGIYFHQISHLNKPDGPIGHEDGAKVLARHFAESQAIARWSHYMFSLERNTTAEDPVVQATSLFRIVKARFDGRKNGQFFHLRYDMDSGKMIEQPKPTDNEEIL